LHRFYRIAGKRGGAILKKSLILAVKIAFSLGLIWYAFSKIDFASAFQLIRRISPWAVIACLGLVLFQQTLASIRLQKILSLLGTKVQLSTAVDAVFVGVFFSQTFISFIGGDAMRVWRIASHRISISVGARAVLLDRVSGFVALVALILLTLPFAFRIVADRAMRIGIGAAVAMGVVASTGFLSMSRLPESFRRWRVVRLLMDVAAQLLAIAKSPRDTGVVLGASFAVQILNPIAIYALALGLGVDANLIDFLVLVPPVLLLALLPISFAGWGVREGAMVVALGLVGISPEQSIAVSVCFGLALIVVGLPGGVLWFVQRRHSPPPVET
jgi:uncharacterized protein (TIRG00374 family)